MPLLPRSHQVINARIGLACEAAGVTDPAGGLGWTADGDWDVRHSASPLSHLTVLLVWSTSVAKPLPPVSVFEPGFGSERSVEGRALGVVLSSASAGVQVLASAECSRTPRPRDRSQGLGQCWRAEADVISRRLERRVEACYLYGIGQDASAGAALDFCFSPATLCMHAVDT